MIANEYEIERQVFRHMSENGITPKENFALVMDGKIHRFSVIEDKHGQKSGAYVIHNNDWPAWAFQDFRKHSGMINGKFNPEELRDYERSEFFSRFEDTPRNRQTQERRTAQKIQEEKLNQENQREAILRAKLEYEACLKDSRTAILDAHNHIYSQLKHLTPHEIYPIDPESRIYGLQAYVKSKYRQGDNGQIGDLLIPLYNAGTGEFQSLQFIRVRKDEKGEYHTEKRFYKGTSITGACFTLIPYPTEILYPDELIICEGVATAASLYRIYDYGIEVYAAMSCHNIINVAKILRKKYPAKKISIGADNDEAGIKAASEAFHSKLADEIFLPPEQGTDWNDFLCKEKGLI